jgi:ABC-2 type transport system permease protein
LFSPLVLALAAVAPRDALLALCGVLIAAASAAAIQYWFRIKTKRSQFRRRQTSSRIALYAEALVTTGWAGVGALAALGTWLAVVSSLVVLFLLFGAWLLSPTHETQEI